MTDRSRVRLIAVDLSDNRSIEFAEFDDQRCHAFAGQQQPLCGERAAYARAASRGGTLCEVCLKLVLSWANSKHKSPTAFGAAHPEA